MGGIMNKTISTILISALILFNSSAFALSTTKKVIGAYVVYKYVTRDKDKGEKSKDKATASEERYYYEEDCEDWDEDNEECEDY